MQTVLDVSLWDGKTSKYIPHRFRLTITELELAKLLGPKALVNSSRKSRIASGAVICEHLGSVAQIQEATGKTPDATTVSELRVYVIQTGSIYATHTTPLMERHAAQMNAGTYDRDAALRDWERIARYGAKGYAREYMGDRSYSGWEKHFNIATRAAAAIQLCDYYAEEIAGMAKGEKR